MEAFEQAPFLVALLVGATLRRWYLVFPAAVVVAIVGPLSAIAAQMIWSEDPGPWLAQTYQVDRASFWIDRAERLAAIFAAIVVAFAAARFLAYFARSGVLGVAVAVSVVVALTVGGMLALQLVPWGRDREVPLALRVADIVDAAANGKSSRCFRDRAALLDVPLPVSRDHVAIPDGTPGALPKVFASLPLLPMNTFGIGRGHERLLTPIEVIRTPRFATYPRDNYLVALTVAVGTEGQVLAAAAIDGPPDAFVPALRIAHTWRFAPFFRDGKPTAVRLKHLFVPTQGPSRPITRHVPFPTVNDRRGLYIHLVQAFEYDRGPSYTVTVRGDGAVRYDGLNGVALVGEHCAQIKSAVVDRLMSELREADFFSLDDSYIGTGTDWTPAVAVTVSVDGRAKTVFDHGGWSAGLPNAVLQVQSMIDDALGVRRWTRGDALTGPSLVAERWNFSSWSADNESMVSGVVAHGDLQALQDLLRLGARPDVDDKGIVPRAAMRGQFDMVRMLLDSGAEWSKDELSQALVEVAYAGGRDDIVRALIARGADVNARGLAQQSVLALAAQAGVPEPVATLLNAGADVKATDQWGETALHKTEFYNPEVRLEPSRTDRGGVVDLLVRAGIPVDARDDWQHTPLIENRSGHEAVAAALIAHGADVNAQDSYGSSALWTNNNPKTTEMLLAAGANPFLRNLQGRTAFDNRSDRGDLDQYAAVFATIERWIAAHPAEAERARKEAEQIGTSRIPKRAEPLEPSIEEITPIGIGPSYPEAFAFLLVVILQMAIVHGVMALPRLLTQR